jgi:hypothetical protein
MHVVAKATSEFPPAKTRALKGGGNRNCESAGGKTGLVGFRRLHMRHAAGSERARGQSHETPHPQERAARPVGQSASLAPLICRGRCGAQSRRGGGRRRLAGSDLGGSFLPQITCADLMACAQSDWYICPTKHAFDLLVRFGRPIIRQVPVEASDPLRAGLPPEE